MKIVKKDQKQAEREKLLKAKKIEEEERRNKYLEGLKSNRLFQKYIIEEIIDAEIKQQEKGIFNNIEALIKATPEEVKNIALSKTSNVALLNKLKRRMLGD